MHLWCTAELPDLETRRFLSGGPLLRSESFPASSISETNHVEARGSSKHPCYTKHFKPPWHHLVSLAAVRSRLRVRHFLWVPCVSCLPVSAPSLPREKWWRKGCSKDVQGYGTPVAPWPDMTWPWRCSTLKLKFAALNWSSSINSQWPNTCLSAISAWKQLLANSQGRNLHPIWHPRFTKTGGFLAKELMGDNVFCSCAVAAVSFLIFIEHATSQRI